MIKISIQQVRSEASLVQLCLYIKQEASLGNKQKFHKMLCKCVVLVSLVFANLLSPSEQSNCCTDKKGLKIFDANLTTGSSYFDPGSTGVSMTWLKTLGTNQPQGNEKCNLQGVARLTLPTTCTNGKHRSRCRLIFDLHFLKDLS